MTPTPEQNAKRFIELSENVSVLSTAETNAVMLARAYLKLETELQQLRLAADGVAEQLEAYMGACGNTGYSTLRETFSALYESGKERIAAYRAAGEGSPKDTGTSRE